MNEETNQEPVFTPLNADRTKRLRFPKSAVTVLSGTLETRGLGLRAVVEINGKRYKVYGASCDLPNCQCDAVLVDAE